MSISASVAVVGAVSVLGATACAADKPAQLSHDAVSCPRPQYASPAADRPRYELTVRVERGLARVAGSLHVAFTPDRGTDRLVFRLWPNDPRTARQGGRLVAGPVTLDRRAAPSRLTDPTTLVVRPPRSLQPGQRVDVAMTWRLTVPRASFDRVSHRGRSLRLGSFFPLLAWEPGVGWATDPPAGMLAEASTSPSADFDVRVRVPAGLRVVATGTRSRDGRWHATAVRDFALAVGPFHGAGTVVRAHAPVRVSVVAEPDVPRGATRRLLRGAATALVAHSRRFGPYPWPAYTVVLMTDLGATGIEYPTLVFQGVQSISLATAHEAGHQWFYSLVGNDQARDPWLDEGLATWSQGRADGILRILERWPIPAAARGRLGAPVSFWRRHQEAYFAGIYAQGAKALASLGPPARVDCALRLYVARNAYGIARPADLVEVLTELFPDARRKLAGFGVSS